MVKAEMNYEQIRKVVNKLPVRQQLRLAQELQKNTWQEQFKQLIKRIRARARKYPVTQEDIDKACEEARKEVYARRYEHRP